MSKYKFYTEKIKFLILFAWWRRWKLVREEWKVTYQEMQEVRTHVEETSQKALDRILEELLERTESSS